MKDYLQEARKLIFSNCKIVDAKTTSVSITLFEKVVAQLLEKIDELKGEK